MKRIKYYLILSLLVLTVSPQAWSRDAARVKHDFESRKALVDEPSLYKVFDGNLSPQQRAAMEFLYAYMPLPDLTDYSGKYFLENVDAALKAREEMPWGATVPGREWYHFVLPVRVNNENLDGSRMVFFEELKERVKGMSMTDAVLEVNHWCHEKVTYQPSDSRTSSPLASIKSAYGRCGEESTFTVAALRAIGIPARQVYTPRWAHTDDNHAWVEAWVDGKWHFLGACEPEAILDLGWFNAPASRGMLMNTLAFGCYDGPEQQLSQSNCYTEINVTSNYAPVDTVKVTVTDAGGKPIKGARVDFQLYNYAEFYPIAVIYTDANGNAALVAGLGDLLLWASDKGQWAAKKCTVGKDKNVTIALGGNQFPGNVMTLDVVPPAQSSQLPVVPDDLAAANDRRKQQEDSLRNAYTATFFTAEKAKAYAAEHGFSEEIVPLLVGSRGNHATITGFLESVQPEFRPQATALLKAISDKDLRDITAEVLTDHFSTASMDAPLYIDYIMNPRVANEMLTPYKSYFRAAIPDTMRRAMAENPRKWVEWCADSIAIDTGWNPQSLRMSPEAVWRHRTTDKGSRDIFFVAAARSMGIPARIDPVTQKTQYAMSTHCDWIDADFTTPLAANGEQGEMSLSYSPAGRISDPVYYTHFTISKIVNGVPQLLNYPEGATWKDIFSTPKALDKGKYLLTTGQRMASGAVLAQLTLFNIAPGERTSQDLTLRQDSTEISVIGNFNSENRYRDTALGIDKSLLSTTGRGYYVLGLITANDEPSVHALNDISAYKEELEKGGRSIILLFADAESASKWDASRFPDLPATVTIGTDIDGKIAAELTAALELNPTSRPVFIIADTFNRVVFVSQGYTIGTGERLLDTLHRLQ